MGFLRTLFWMAVTVVVVVFSLRNWVPVTINLFGNLQADVKLPVLLAIFFLLGLVPAYAWHRAALWRQRRALGPGLPPPIPVAPVPIAAAAPLRTD